MSGAAVVPERGVGRVRPVDVEGPHAQVEPRVADRLRRDARRIVDLGEPVRRARGGGAPVEVAREHADVLAARWVVLTLVEEDDAGRLAEEHLAPLEGEHADSGRGLRVRRELVGHHVVAVGPDADLRVVEEDVGAEVELVEVVRAGRVAGRRDGDALAVLVVARLTRGRGDELRDQPSPGDLVVDDDWISVVVDLALAVRVRPELVDRRGRAQDGAGLRVDGEVRVHGLDVLDSLRPRRRYRAGGSCSCSADRRAGRTAGRCRRSSGSAPRSGPCPSVLHDRVVGVRVPAGLKRLVVARVQRPRDHR